MKIEELKNEDYMPRIKKAIDTKEQIFMYGITKKPIILKGNNDIGEKYCKEHNIEIYPSFNRGGCIVINTGDIDTAMFRYEGWEDGAKTGNLLIEYLKKKGLDIINNGNDFLVDGKYKVGSYSSVDIGDRCIYTGIHLSMSVDMEAIHNVCLKPMVKIPKGLSEYGITREEMINELLRIIKENY